MSTTPAYDYDLVVIGGGSGGLACAKEATAVNPSAKVAVFDFVKPTIHGTKWGLGGTCVNVGCIPKKLMHHAGTIGHLLHDHAPQYGWSIASASHDWPRLASLIGDYIKSLNFSYRVGLQSAAVKYFDAAATFTDDHTISYTARNGESSNITFAHAVIASGGRPTYPDIPGAELAITSDDLFWLKSAPGPRILVVGAGYISVECASFLRYLGKDVSVMIRGQILRKMDAQSAQQIGELMERDGIRFIKPATPLRFDSVNAEPIPPDAKRVTDNKFEVAESTPMMKVYRYISGSTQTIDISTQKHSFILPKGPIRVTYQFGESEVRSEVFDTVLLAIGRTANTAELNLNCVNVTVINGKVLVDDKDATTNDHIYAIGDVATGIPRHSTAVDSKKIEVIAVDRPELTPVAIQTGVYLARRLFGDAQRLMQYRYIPTTVFTSPSEYAFVGLSEEQAHRDAADGGIGDENVEVFWSRFGSLEQSPLHPEHHYTPPRSTAFVNANLWARRQVDEAHVDWPEVMFTMDTTSAVTVEENGTLIPVRVTKAYRDHRQRLVYDLVSDDDHRTFSGVEPSRLELSDEAAAEDSSVWSKASSLAKIIVDKRTDRVVGLHFVGDSAGEVVQGFALALSIGATKAQFDELVGIHPTSAEEFAVLAVTKQSKLSGLKQAGCGGGRCG